MFFLLSNTSYDYLTFMQPDHARIRYDVWSFEYMSVTVNQRLKQCYRYKLCITQIQSDVMYGLSIAMVNHGLLSHYYGGVVNTVIHNITIRKM